MIEHSRTFYQINLSSSPFFQGIMVQNIEKTQKKLLSYHPLSNERGSEQSKQASKWASAVERASEASSAEQVNEWAVRANERMDKHVA